MWSITKKMGTTQILGIILGLTLVSPQLLNGFSVATTAVGNSGATNAGLLAVSMLSTTDERLAEALQEYRDSLKEKVAESNAQLV